MRSLVSHKETAVCQRLVWLGGIAMALKADFYSLGAHTGPNVGSETPTFSL